MARARQDVLLIGRPGHIEAINKHGLRLVTPTCTYTLWMPAVTSSDHIDFRPTDVVFLCVKGQDTEEALRNLRPVAPGAHIFSFQNGVRNEEIAARYFPSVYGVMVNAWMMYLTDGEVTALEDPPGKLVIGCYPRGADELAGVVAKKLKTAGFSVWITPDIMPYKLGKLMANLANAVSAITNVWGRDIDFIVSAARQEFRDILTKAHIRWISMDELRKEWSEMALPPRSRLDSKVLGSTWQSLARQQGSAETEFLNGEVVQLAKAVGQRAPINEGLLHICQEMVANRETPGKYSPQQLGILLGLKYAT
jgi:2-dehydropantoate 2-reductase